MMNIARGDHRHRARLMDDTADGRSAIENEK